MELCSVEGCEIPKRKLGIPISRGGSHGVGNLLPACERCNKSKATKLLIEWRTLNGTR